MDDEGHVANFVETEQILRTSNGSLSAFVQVTVMSGEVDSICASLPSLPVLPVTWSAGGGSNVVPLDLTSFAAMVILRSVVLVSCRSEVLSHYIGASRKRGN